MIDFSESMVKEVPLELVQLLGQVLEVPWVMVVREERRVKAVGLPAVS